MIGEGIQSTNQRKHSYVQDRVEVGFFTDPSVCIGCKACEVACKEWNQVPDDGFTWSGNSYDNTGHLGASTWRHVMFLEQDRPKGNQVAGPMSLARARGSISLGFLVRRLQALRRSRLPRSMSDRLDRAHGSWLGAGAERCLQRLRLLRRLVSVRRDRSPATNRLPDAGGAFKCTFCYDRQKSGLVPACAKVCPTESIVFGRLDDLRARGADRVEALTGKAAMTTRNLRSDGNVRSRHPRLLPDSRETGRLRTSAEAADSNDLSKVGMDFSICHGHRINYRNARGLRIFFMMKLRSSVTVAVALWATHRMRASRTRTRPSHSEAATEEREVCQK